MTPPAALLGIVCGFERGGTTALSELLRQHPGVDAGFEGGFLLAEAPGEFPRVEPYHGMALRGWGLAREEMEQVCAAGDWDEMYARLAERFGPGIRVFDKTPKYLERLDEVLARVPGVLAVVIVRDPRALFWSWRKREEEPREDWIKRFARRYLAYAAGHQRALAAGHGDRILLVQHESFSLDPAGEGRRVFEFLGLDFDPAYLEFEPRYRANVFGTGVSAAFVTEYRDHLTPDECAEILAATREHAAWRWDPPEEFRAPERPEPVRFDHPTGARTREDRRLTRRVAAVAAGGVDRFAGHVVAAGLHPLDAVLDLSWRPVSPAPVLTEAFAEGRFRRVDWLGRMLAGDVAADGTVLSRLGARFDVVTGHSVLPMLDREQAAAMLAEIASVLAPRGWCFLSLFLDDRDSPKTRPLRHVKGRSFRNRAPFHLRQEELDDLAGASGLVVEGIEAIEHPAGQRVALLGHRG